MLSWKVYILHNDKVIENLVVADDIVGALEEVLTCGWEVHHVLAVVLLHFEEKVYENVDAIQELD